MSVSLLKGPRENLKLDVPHQSGIMPRAVRRQHTEQRTEMLTPSPQQ